jgi:hypothetical protein
MDAARLCRARPRGLRQERDRLSRRAHDRGGCGLRAAFPVRGRARGRYPSAASTARAAESDAMRAGPARGLVRASDGRGKFLSRGGVDRGEVARAACAQARPHEGGAGRGRLAAGLRLYRRRPDGAFRAGCGGGRPPDPAHGAVPPAQRSLRTEPARAGGDRHRPAQCRGRVEQGAARQFRLSLRRARL